MSKNKRGLTAEEHKLWMRVASTVRSRRARSSEDHVERIALPAPKKAATRVAAPPSPHSRSPASPPQNRSSEKRVRRGDVDIGATLDLHGHTQDSALAALSRFLHRAQKRGDRAVIVVTGAGRGGEGVLKRMLPIWLSTQDIRRLISGYSPAHRSHGGAGAFYVFVKRSRGERV